MQIATEASDGDILNIVSADSAEDNCACRQVDRAVALELQAAGAFVGAPARYEGQLVDARPDW